MKTNKTQRIARKREGEKVRESQFSPGDSRDSFGHDFMASDRAGEGEADARHLGNSGDRNVVDNFACPVQSMREKETEVRREIDDIEKKRKE
ncbi:hypothetical protein TIFTF001_014845 [Ficus carica]|uniref:Uncharacterized protein n=1 Tax=Ficus carica TaxID=3494 RepID=A0AA88AGS6_FICCA|nr:hypothetical protein TIFTF001_014845 [Ficus carica]